MKKLRMADKNEAEEDSGETGDPEKGNLAKGTTMQRRILRKVAPSKKRKESPERVCTMLLVMHSTMCTDAKEHDNTHGNANSNANGNIHVNVHGNALLPCLQFQGTTLLYCTVFCTSTAVQALPVVVAAYIHSK